VIFRHKKTKPVATHGAGINRENNELTTALARQGRGLRIRVQMDMVPLPFQEALAPDALHKPSSGAMEESRGRLYSRKTEVDRKAVTLVCPNPRSGGVKGKALLVTRGYDGLEVPLRQRFAKPSQRLQQAGGAGPARLVQRDADQLGPVSQNQA